MFVSIKDAEGDDYCDRVYWINKIIKKTCMMHNFKEKIRKKEIKYEFTILNYSFNT